MELRARKSRGLIILGLTLALTNLALWFGVIGLRNGYDSLLGRRDDPCRPGVFSGVQELLVYYDPWLARGLFPVVYTLGFVAIGFLFKTAPDATDRPAPSFGAILVAVVLLGFEGVWLFLIAMAIFCRGPNWNFFWPWEAWDAHLVVPINRSNLSEYAWFRLTNHAGGEGPWFVRESPGLLFAVGYLLLGVITAMSVARNKGCFLAYCWLVFLLTLILALVFPPVACMPVTGLFLAVGYLVHRVFSEWRKPQSTGACMPFWRSFLLVFLIQLAFLVPLKMLLYGLCNWKYFIFLPEFNLNV
jgi:hypothetical protein